VLPPTSNAIIVIEPNFKIIPPCLCMPCEDCDFLAPTGRPLNSGLLVEQWRQESWQFVGDLVPRIDRERVAVELPENPGGALRIRVLWEGTHSVQMVGWVAEAASLSPHTAFNRRRYSTLVMVHSIMFWLRRTATWCFSLPKISSPLLSIPRH
jgi:hypothetical protein